MEEFLRGVNQSLIVGPYLVTVLEIQPDSVRISITGEDAAAGYREEVLYLPSAAEGQQLFAEHDSLASDAAVDLGVVCDFESNSEFDDAVVRGDFFDREQDFAAEEFAAGEFSAEAGREHDDELSLVAQQAIASHRAIRSVAWDPAGRN